MTHEGGDKLEKVNFDIHHTNVTRKHTIQSDLASRLKSTIPDLVKMSQPSTVNQTFDTSLLDVDRSFSSTETNTSGSSAKENVRPEQPTRNVSPYKQVTTDELYAQWASTYDTDGNVLQFVDDLMMRELLTKFTSLVGGQRERDVRHDVSPGRDALRILDLGCGTGRSTLKLLQADWSPRKVEVVGWDSSRGMLDLAKTKYHAAAQNGTNSMSLKLEQNNISVIESLRDEYSDAFDGLISTLVLEHIPIDTFFNSIARVLRPGGYALVTNMHPEMGALSKAGFKTAFGERVKGTSYVYTVAETIDAAKKAGLDVIGEAEEMAVDERMIDGGVVHEVVVEKGMVAERARKWVGTNVWYGLILRKA